MGTEERIDAQDKTYLGYLQSAYQKKLSMFFDIWQRFNKEHDDFEIECPEEIRKSLNVFAPEDFDIADKTMTLQEDFRNNIFQYFRERYQVFTINKDKELDFYDKFMHYSKYSKKEVELKKLNFGKVFMVQNYNTVLDEIFEQLGNDSLTDRLIKETKNDLFDECFNLYRKTWRITVKDNVISYRNGFGFLEEERWNRDTYRYVNSQFIYKFLKAYSVMLFGRFTVINGVDKLMSCYVILDSDDVKNGFVPNCEGNIIEKIKVFKNGRVDIKFQTPKQAQDFANEWCGMNRSDL